MNEEPLLCIGESGDHVTIVKKSIKPGKNSNVKPGKTKTFFLKKPMAIGHPVVEKIISDKAKTKGIALGFQKTSKIVSLKENDDGFILETETSFYDVFFG